MLKPGASQIAQGCGLISSRVPGTLQKENRYARHMDGVSLLELG